jgi:hypothetical protein
MTSVLAGSLARTIGGAMAGLFLPATLSRTTKASAAAATPWEPGAGTTKTYSCKAIHDTWEARYLAGGVVKASDRKIIILASSLPGITPEAGDVVTIRGEAFTIFSEGDMPAVQSDPALATWTCRGRK